MLVRLMYASRAAETVRPETLNTILKQSTSHNPGVGVTGVLCFSGDIYLQVLFDLFIAEQHHIGVALVLPDAVVKLAHL